MRITATFLVVLFYSLVLVAQLPDYSLHVLEAEGNQLKLELPTSIFPEASQHYLYYGNGEGIINSEAEASLYYYNQGELIPLSDSLKNLNHLLTYGGGDYFYTDGGEIYFHARGTSSIQFIYDLYPAVTPQNWTPSYTTYTDGTLLFKTPRGVHIDGPNASAAVFYDGWIYDLLTMPGGSSFSFNRPNRTFLAAGGPQNIRQIPNLNSLPIPISDNDFFVPGLGSDGFGRYMFDQDTTIDVDFHDLQPLMAPTPIIDPIPINSGAAFRTIEDSLYFTDGTTVGTYPLLDQIGNAIIDERLYFDAFRTGSKIVYEKNNNNRGKLYAIDGSRNGTKLLIDFTDYPEEIRDIEVWEQKKGIGDDLVFFQSRADQDNVFAIRSDDSVLNLSDVPDIEDLKHADVVSNETSFFYTRRITGFRDIIMMGNRITGEIHELYDTNNSVSLFEATVTHLYYKRGLSSLYAINLETGVITDISTLNTSTSNALPLGTSDNFIEFYASSTEFGDAIFSTDGESEASLILDPWDYHGTRTITNTIKSVGGELYQYIDGLLHVLYQDEWLAYDNYPGFRVLDEDNLSAGRFAIFASSDDEQFLFTSGAPQDAHVLDIKIKPGFPRDPVTLSMRDSFYFFDHIETGTFTQHYDLYAYSPVSLQRRYIYSTETSSIPRINAFKTDGIDLYFIQDNSRVYRYGNTNGVEEVQLPESQDENPRISLLVGDGITFLRESVNSEASLNSSIYHYMKSDGTVGTIDTLFSNDDGTISEMARNGDYVYFKIDRTFYALQTDSGMCTPLGEEITGRFRSDAKLFALRDGRIAATNFFVDEDDQDEGPSIYVFDGTEMTELVKLSTGNHYSSNDFFRHVADDWLFTDYKHNDTFAAYLYELSTGELYTLPEIMTDLESVESLTNFNVKDNNGDRIYARRSDRQVGAVLYTITFQEDKETAFVFHDLNADGVKDPNEPGIPNVAFLIDDDPTGRVYGQSDTSGQLCYPGISGIERTLILQPEACWTSTTPNNISIPNPASEHNFGLTPNVAPSDPEGSITTSILRCNQPATVWINAYDAGCSPSEEFKIRLSLPEGVVADSASVSYSVLENSLEWTFSNATGYESYSILLHIRMPDETFVGLEQNFGLVTSSDHISGDTLTYSRSLRCAIDPNDKQVSPYRPESGLENYTLHEETLSYTIRFQNTGNDTAFTVRIEDQLSENLDWDTFKPIRASHDYIATLNNMGLATFLFNDILLPDSTTNQVKSNGFVTFEIMPKLDLADYTTLLNNAEIFFDLNEPIITNMVISTLVESFDYDEDGSPFWEDCADDDSTRYPGAVEIAGNNIDENCDDMDGTTSSNAILDGNLLVYPNPVSRLLYIDYESRMPLLGKLLSVDGRLVKQFTFSQSHVLKLEMLPDGLYILRLSDPLTGATLIKKIILSPGFDR